MKHRPALLLTILIYVTLDLSLPTMPGAFVFDPADSVESIQSTRARAAADVVVLPATGRGAAVWAQRPPQIKNRLPLTSRVERRGPPVEIRSSGSPLDPAPPSEDPH